MAEKNMTYERFEIEKSAMLPFGTRKLGEDIVISIPTDEDISQIVFYDRVTGEAKGRANITKEYKKSDIYAFKVKNAAKYNYRLLNDKKVYVRDAYAKCVTDGVYYGVYDECYDWEDDKNPNHRYEDSFIYRLHVRGFTKHTSSKVKHKGTYTGIVEKIQYLKELGVTAVELMPAYEFDEDMKNTMIADKKNYWGYGKGYYFAPKESYSVKGKGSQVKEFKDMVKALHKAGIEVIMDFYFVPGANPYMIQDCLRHWVLEYHIDGIHVNTEVVPASLIKEDPILSLVKIFADNWDVAQHFDSKAAKNGKRLAIFNDGFMINVRKFIKSDEGQVFGMQEKLRRNPESAGVINYLANHYTFTLMDTVSYNRKHNEANGENNQDGTDYNYSWNCGLEGETRKKKINELRIRQIKNALTILFLSQGTPMIYSGDEMGKSQKGNNNPYCQDNAVSYINWNQLKSNEEIYEYVKKLVKFRKEHRLLHMPKEPRGMDYLSTGTPDMSFHGLDPWRVDGSYGSRQFAVLYSGDYDKEGDTGIYAAFNMYWETSEFHIPEPRKGKKWVLSFITDSTVDVQKCVKSKKLLIPSRTIVVMEEQNVTK